MGKNKLRKFAEMEQIPLVFQYPFARLQVEKFPLKGKWHSDFFHNDHPIVLELGCGKGEYTVGLARRFPEMNFIGIDIKGARMYTGARQAFDTGMANVAFIRTSIELLPAFFAPSEVAQIWITFPDPQMKKVNKRLTSTRFMDTYRRVLADGGTIHLKTDSPFLYTYTSLMVGLNKLPVLTDTADLYHSGIVTDILDIKTHYEQQWLARGLSIKYLSFSLPHDGALEEPQDEIPFDTYRSFGRGTIQSGALTDGVVEQH
ncbi:MAG: tRNA (guanosine(46)-N7)-methyltransferase TrmB [Muribaculaceae bacterium]|nr:tRNA (guanosine(46)-N7)-methyltransferase TrmB [Muribaculaceae bacterium]